MLDAFKWVPQYYNTPKEKPMSKIYQDKQFQTRIFYGPEDLDKMSDEGVINVIREIDARIKTMKATSIAETSEKMQKYIENAEADRVALIKYFDARK